MFSYNIVSHDSDCGKHWNAVDKKPEFTWLTGFSMSLVIGYCDDFSFGFTTLSLKQFTATAVEDGTT